MIKNKLTFHAGLALLLALCVVLTLAPTRVLAAEDNAEVTVVVTSFLGTVTVKRAASEKTFNAFVGLKLKQGDVVTVTPGGEIVIDIGNDKTIKGLSDSSFKISSLSGTDADSQAGFTLIKGTVFNEVRAPQSSTDGMTVRTGNTVAGVRGTTYTVSLRAVDGVTVRTLEGSVFLDKVLERVETDANASLVTRQETVSAGQGSTTAREGIYELSITDFTAAELEYIAARPEVFPELAGEAQEILESLPPTQQTAPEQREIIYEPSVEPEPPAESGGSSGEDIPPVIVRRKTITVKYGGDAIYSGYYGREVTFEVAAANQSKTLIDYLTFNIGDGYLPGKVGYTVGGWTTENTGAGGIIGTAQYGRDVRIADLPDGVALYPLFVSASDEGTKAKPYLILKENFPHFASFVYDHLDAYYRLDSDISYGSYAWPPEWQWTPIGTEATPFTGGFDGKGYTISNFTMTATQKHSGFFGYIFGTSPTSDVVIDLTLKDAVITATADNLYALGGIAGYLHSGTISFCNVSGSVTGTNENTNLNVGGIVGIADIYSSSSGQGPIEAASITDCTFTGSVSAINGDGSNVSAGGIVGCFGSYALTGCTVDADVTATSLLHAYAGGICGTLKSADTFSLHRYSGAGKTREVVAYGNSEAYAGGIVGSAGGSSTPEINKCSVNGGNIRAAAANDTHVGSALECVGGIAGNTAGSTSIKDCYVAQTRIEALRVSTQAGGIVGFLSEGSAYYCYVSDVEIFVSDDANAFAGGIAGTAYYPLYGCVVFSGSINQDQSASIAGCGRIVGQTIVGTNQSYAATGGFVIGSSLIVANGSPNHGTDKSLIDQTFLVSIDWDFNIIWQWDVNIGRPTLRAFNVLGPAPVLPLP